MAYSQRANWQQTSHIDNHNFNSASTNAKFNDQNVAYYEMFYKSIIDQSGNIQEKVMKMCELIDIDPADLVDK